ncbi:MAG: ribosome-associated translation inhibitor RaiA [bacterium]|nr:ribosome-associated translation inhibitor RaiA [bacterium]
MPLQITGRHMTVTEEQKDYIDKKVNRLRRLCPKIDELSFRLTKEKLNYQADAILRAGSLTAQASIQTPQVLEAIDMLVDKIEAQVTRSKTKRTDKKTAARGKTRAQIPGEAGEPAAETDEDEEEPEARDAVEA